MGKSLAFRGKSEDGRWIIDTVSHFSDQAIRNNHDLLDIIY